jgi:hypothetical protein
VSRERKIGEAEGAPVDAAEILAALVQDYSDGRKSADRDRRRDAVSRYLSASDGWREASRELGGAFAARDEGLRREQDE